MNILYDTYIYRIQKAGGVNRYFSETISHLPSSFRPFIFSKIENRIHTPENKNLKFFWLPRNLSRSSSLLRLWMRSIDLIHPSYYQLCPPLTWENIPGNVVITVYDFIMARFADRTPHSTKVINNQTAAIKRADHIICISQATQADLLERFPECASRSSVVPLASTLPAPSPSAKNLYQQRYFLYVGHRSFYKNFPLALQTFAHLKKQFSDLRLVVVGDPWSDEEKKQINDLGIMEAIDLVTHPDDATLVVLYQYCEALLYLSEYEGFGLPPLEAMNMGVPVIALKTSSLPEVIGSGGILIEPTHASPKKIAEVAASLLEDEQRRRILSQEAIKQASQFSWQRTVQETLHVYQQFAR